MAPGEAGDPATLNLRPIPKGARRWPNSRTNLSRPVSPEPESDDMVIVDDSLALIVEVGRSSE